MSDGSYVRGGEAPSHATVEAHGLSRRYGRRLAVNDLSLQVPSGGSIYGLLGPNGAGKTTSVRMLSGTLAPSGGRAWVCGWELTDRRQWREGKRLVSTVGDRDALPNHLTVRECLRTYALGYRIERCEGERRMDGLLSYFDLGEVAGVRAGSLSRGQRQRAALACALLPRPEVIFLDEPTLALDVAGLHLLKTVLADFARRGKTVFLTTHNLLVARELCSGGAILSHGELIASGTMEELRYQAGTRGEASLEEVYAAATGLQTPSASGLDFLWSSADNERISPG